MVDFDFPDEQLQNRHEMWLKEQLQVSVPGTKVKELTGTKPGLLVTLKMLIKILVYRDLGLPRRLPGPKTVGVRKTQNGAQLPASIVVESLNDTAYKTLKPLYRRQTLGKKVLNLIIFHWFLDDNRVNCTLEHYTYQQATASLVLKKCLVR